MTTLMAAMLCYMRLFGWFIQRHMRKHLLRTLAVFLGIALGAAVFTSVRLAVHATLDAFSKSMAFIAGNSDMTIVRPGGRVPDTLVAQLMRHPAVKTASPILTSYVRPIDRETPFLLVGIDPLLDRDLRHWSVQTGGQNQSTDWSEVMTQPGTIVIGGPLSDLFGWRSGGQVWLIHSNRTQSFTVLAQLNPDGLAMVEGGRVALCDIATFQEFTGLFGLADRIDVQFKKAVKDPQKALAPLLPEGAEIRSPKAFSQSGRGMIRAYELSLTFLSFISLFVGMFLVYSLVALNAAARRPELAVMRATGASKHMIFYLFIGEGALIGLVGWLVALPISGLMVRYLLAGVSKTVSMLFVRVQVDQLALDPWEILLSLFITLMVAVLAALQPAREAMGIPPREAMDIAPSTVLRPQVIRHMALVGFGLLLMVYPATLLPSPPGISLGGYLAAFLLFVGFATLAPLLLQQSGRLLAPGLLRIGGKPAFLAAGYIRQSGVQSAISVGALITAVALFTALVVMIFSFRSTVGLWVHQSIAGDLYVRPKLAELNRFRDPLPQSVVTALKTLTIPVELVPMHRMELQLKGRPHLFEAIDYAAYIRHSRFIWMGGGGDRIEADLMAGKGVAVSEVFANTSGLKTGDRYQVRIGEQLLDEPILGVFRDYRTRGGAVYYSLKHYQERFKNSSWSGVQVNFERRGPALASDIDRVRSALLACCAEAVEMIDGPGLRRAIMRIFDETFAITTVLLLIALVVAALGIATTLAVLVLQRRVQINTIRAIGGSIGQLSRMIVWEAGLIVLVGQITGLICGFILSVLLIYVVNRQSFGWTFLYQVDWFTLMVAVPLIFMAALLAALPAVRLAQSASPATLLRGGTQ